MRLKFRDQVPTFAGLFHLHVHFYNGAIGTEAEMKGLVKPVELFNSDPLNPIAAFTRPAMEVQTPLEEAEERGVFAMENAELLLTKDDLIGYAAQFDIELKKATNINLKTMLANLEEAAIEKGLIPAK